MEYYALMDQSNNLEQVAQNADRYLKEIEFSNEQMETIVKLKDFIQEKSSK